MHVPAVPFKVWDRGLAYNEAKHGPFLDSISDFGVFVVYVRFLANHTDENH